MYVRAHNPRKGVDLHGRLGYCRLRRVMGVRTVLSMEECAQEEVRFPATETPEES